MAPNNPGQDDRRVHDADVDQPLPIVCDRRPEHEDGDKLKQPAQTTAAG